MPLAVCLSIGAIGVEDGLALSYAQPCLTLGIGKLHPGVILTNVMSQPLSLGIALATLIDAERYPFGDILACCG